MTDQNKQYPKNEPTNPRKNNEQNPKRPDQADKDTGVRENIEE